MNRNDASERQVQASTPTATTWLSANAGSGKTRVLTDRVARLLLAGVQPQHILCLTYTKAAATEMQNRLFRRLGEWAMKPDAELHAALAELGDEGRHAPGALAKARQLFARAIETPGGLRIQTIHSFCATLLRRFPLEAGVSPQFTELDDRASRLLRAGIVEEMAETAAPDVMAEVARAYTGEDFTALMEQVAGKRAGFAVPLTGAQARGLFGVPVDESFAAILADVFLGYEAALMAKILPVMVGGKITDAKNAAQLAALDLAAPTAATLSALEDIFLYKGDASTPFGAKVGKFPTKDMQKSLAVDLPNLDALMLRVEAARLRRLALMAAQKTAVLHRFAAAFLPLYARRKADRGFLDFDDLITRAKGLLTNPSVAAWVLFRLDGGIDHILVDEAQDTSPDQWRVIELLAAEFTAGEGTRSGGRTLFVVGDKKQSIYSFQGADVAAFDEKHALFQQNFSAAGQQFQTLALEYSFRSSPAILRLVDETFGNRFPQALGDSVLHHAFKDQMPGRVDLWALIEPTKADKDDNWEDPVDLITETHHSARLAEKIAREIKAMIDARVQIPVDAKEAAPGCRPVHAGDFLILVQRRSALFSEIIRACKKLDLPIAGADRLKLGAELAVKDLAALLAFLATPEDDLSLAALLRSPLCGWTEAELYDLAHGRKGYLWEALRNRTDHPATLAMLTDLRDQADFLRPFDLIERALTRHDGRRRLLARLGPEAEDGIDELLSQALAYERNDIPSLTGFQIWLETDDIEVKRQMDSEGRRIRVMTVHGAKGLEAPIVILPDTTDRKAQDRDEIYVMPGDVPVWKTGADDSPDAIVQVRAARRAKTEQESLRLLYVALTRARAWLIVAGAGTVKSEGAWYQLVAQGMQAVGAVGAAGGMLRYQVGQWPADAEKTALTPPEPFILPGWSALAAADPLRPLPLISPSDLGGAKALPGETDGTTEDAAKARGTALHLLLEHLPRAMQTDWPMIAAALVPDAKLCANLLPEVTLVLTAPHLAHLFGPGTLAEVPITADLMDRRLYGSIDRLIITDTKVLAVDYKSNHLIPDSAAHIPEGLLRQLGAYACALCQIYPTRRVETAVLWTQSARLMPVDPDIVSAALARTTIDSVRGP
jgi:ATP-dependent helicase/nuclease subunit A